MEKFLTDPYLTSLKQIKFKLVETCGVICAIEGLNYYRDYINPSIQTIKITEVNGSTVRNLKNLMKLLNFPFQLDITFVIFQNNTAGGKVLTTIRNNNKYCQSVGGIILANDYDQTNYQNDIDITYKLPNSVTVRYVSKGI